MKLDAALPPLELGKVPTVARAAEDFGFDGLWTSETQHNAFLPHALIAEHTRQIEHGTAVAIAFARSPGDLAYTAWDLAQASGGRFILGLGTQVKAHITRRFGMDWPESVVGKLREQIGAIRAFWRAWQNNEKLDYRGDYYKLNLMTPFFDPGPIAHPNIPIYIAGVNTGLAQLAGEICDGFLAHPFHTPDYLREVMLPAIEKGAAKGGRSRSDVTLSVTVFAAVTPEDLGFARMQIAFYASTPSYRAVMDFHGWGEVAEKLSWHAAKGEWAEMPMLITDEMLAAFVTRAESAAALAEAIQSRYTGLADRIALYTPFIPGEKDAFWRELLDAFHKD
jgi:probable F420-dependent oxidoreductase